MYLHVGASYTKYSFSWWMYRSTQQNENSRGEAKGRKKNVIAFVFRWKSTPHFISMNIFLYFFITYFLFNLFLLPSLHLVHVGIYDDCIFRAFDARENNRNWKICTRFCNKSNFFPEMRRVLSVLRGTAFKWPMEHDGEWEAATEMEQETINFSLCHKDLDGNSIQLQLCASSISLHKNKLHNLLVLVEFWEKDKKKVKNKLMILIVCYYNK